MASKLSLQQADEFFFQSEREIREKRKYFTLRPPARKRREISGCVQKVKWCLHIGQQMPSWQKVVAGPFWPCFACPKLGDAGRTSCQQKYGGAAKSWAVTIWTLKQNPPERKFLYILKKFPQEDFALKSKLWPPSFLLHRLSYFFLSWNKGQLWAALTRPCSLSTPLCYTYSEPSGHENSPGDTQNIPYLLKKLSKSRLSDPFFGLFLVISEVGSQIYIVNLAIFQIWVFSASFLHEITLYAIDLDKKRSEHLF